MNLFQAFIPLFLPTSQVIKTESPPMDRVDQIICFSNTAIGDTLFHTPLFRSIKKHYPDKKLIVVLNPYNAKLFATNPYIDEILLYDGKTKHFLHALRTLRKKRPELVLILHSNEPQATPLAVLSGAKYIYKFPNQKNPFHPWHSNPPQSIDTTRYIIKEKLKYLSFLQIEEEDVRMELFLKSSWQERIEHFFHKQQIKQAIGFQIGAATVSRMWFDEKWIELAHIFLQHHPNLHILLTGSQNEYKMIESIKKRIASERVINCAGEFKLGEAAALIERLALLITPDTGPLHIAAALHTPTLALYAVMDHRHTNPAFDQEIHAVVQKERTCEICLPKKCRLPECMQQITPQEVYQRATRLLEK